MDAIDLAAKQLGVETLRPIQRQMIESAMQGQHCLGVFPTGFGKSICHQVPALLYGTGVSLVFTPLISLMDDQIRQLTAAGVPAAAIHSRFSSAADQKRILEELQAGKYRLFYCSPERIRNTRRNLMDYLDGVEVNFIVIDEVHCLIGWQEDFRPEYAQIAKLIERMHPKAVIALTATAGRFMRDQIKHTLGIPMVEFVAETVDRPNLQYTTMPQTMTHLRLWLQEHAGQPGIVFCRSIDQTMKIARRFGGACYHGQLSSAERVSNQTAFMTGQQPLMVATNAFGMGINKPDIRWILHYDLPLSLDEFAQECGRAGRDGQPSECVICIPQTTHLQQFFVKCKNPPIEVLRSIYDDLVQQDADQFWRRPKPIEGVHHDAIESGLAYLKHLGIIESKYMVGDGFWIKILKPYIKAIRGPTAILATIEECGAHLSAVSERSGSSRRSILAALRLLRKQNIIRYRPPDHSMMYRLLQPFTVDAQQVAMKENLAQNNLRLMRSYLDMSTNTERHDLLKRYFDCSHDINQSGTCSHCALVLYPLGFELAQEAMTRYLAATRWLEAHIQ